MKKEILFFTEDPPKDKAAIHVWFSKTDLPHEKLLKELLGRYLGEAPKDLATTPEGKLYLPDQSLYFNLSDSDGWLAVAFSWQQAIGIDVERVYPIDEMDQVVLNCFSSREQEYVKEKDSLVRFWQIWNRKEACCKARGVGLQDNMKEWDCFGEEWVSVKDTWVKSLSLQDSFSGAVAICK